MFDMDGTILDSIGGWFVSYKKFLKSKNLIETKELTEMLKNKRLLERCKIIKEYFKLDMEQMDIYKSCLVFIKYDYDNTFKPKDFVIESLEYLKNKDYKISLNTATKQPLWENCFKKFDLFKYFSYIQTCKECTFLKNDERFYKVSIERHGVDPKDILFFDDTKEPLETARKLKIKTCLVFDKDTSKDYFDDFKNSDFKIKNISVENLKKLGL